MAWDGPDRFFVCWLPWARLVSGWWPCALHFCWARSNLRADGTGRGSGLIDQPVPRCSSRPPRFRGPLRPGGLTSFLGYLSMSTGEPVCNGYYLTMLFSSSWTLTVFPVPAPVPQGLAGP
ncbi:hypothetical protein BKA56DRAFT_619778 [Ilyonectria sp. MPI-CAGE-AT-0026]|nr:hypothetical protein BKA56DRAFT_619778 [Ilyonectria sp. MPI-CAGE-AT-0026]